MAARTIFAWRNWAAEHGRMEFSISFEPAAPATNLLTPQLGQLAIGLPAPDEPAFNVRWDIGDSPESGGRPVQILGLLNHNIIDLGPDRSMTITLLDSNNKAHVLDENASLNLFTAGDGTQQNHLFWLLPATLPATDTGVLDTSKITSILIEFGVDVICGTVDPFTGAITTDVLRLGGIWAGPIWEPVNGIRVAHTPGITEKRRGAVSIGGQVYASPEARVRRLSFTLGLLSDAEVYSTDLLNSPSLQQMATWCSVSRPLIVIPDATDPEAVYLQGIYGYIDQDVQWSSVEGVGYTSTIQITEAL